MGEYVKILTALVAALGGWEFVRYMLHRKTNSRIAEANAFKVEREALIEDYRRVQEEMAVLKKKVDELYDKVHRLEDERLGLISENNELRLALKEAEHNVCVRPDDECMRRQPPRDHCRLKRLARGYYDKFYTDGEPAKGEADCDEEDKELYGRKEDTGDADGGVSEKPDKG